MRNLAKALAVTALVVPATALAVISGTKHDLSFGNTAADTRAAAATNGGDQLCIFCHTPHRATNQNLLWNRAAMTKAFTWGSATTTAGTPLSGTIQPKSMACLSCHDGTVALGDVMNSGGQALTILMQGARQVAGVMQGSLTVDYRVGTNGVLGSGAGANNHPISIAYPGGGTNTYNGGVSAAAAADYATVATGCATPTGLCTGAAGAAAAVTIYSAGAGATLAYGIECGSCHDVHNKFTQASFLRASNAGSALCLACHVK